MQLSSLIANYNKRPTLIANHDKMFERSAKQTKDSYDRICMYVPNTIINATAYFFSRSMYDMSSIY